MLYVLYFLKALVSLLEHSYFCKMSFTFLLFCLFALKHFSLFLPLKLKNVSRVLLLSLPLDVRIYIFFLSQRDLYRFVVWIFEGKLCAWIQGASYSHLRQLRYWLVLCLMTSTAELSPVFVSVLPDLNQVT